MPVNRNHLAVGRHAVEAPCPDCGVIELIYITLFATEATREN